MLSVLNFVLRLWGGIAGDRRDLVLENTALPRQVDVLMRTRRRFCHNSDAKFAAVSRAKAAESTIQAGSVLDF